MKHNSKFSMALTPILALFFVISFGLAVSAATESVYAMEVESAATTTLKTTETASENESVAKNIIKSIRTKLSAAKNQKEQEETETVVETMAEVVPEVVELSVEAKYMPHTGIEPKEVPLYNQLDYSKVPYGGGTVATSGCGITCAAMAISYYNDVPVLPDELAPQFNNRKYSNLARMEQALAAYGIEYQKTASWNSVYQALQNGQLVISMQEVGIFTNAQHFILITGMSYDGKIFVNDPYGYNYVKTCEMMSGFANGFDVYQIHNTASGYWILSAENASN